MKRTVKIWLAAVMSGVLLAGGAAMTGQAPWGMEAQAHSGRKMCIRDRYASCSWAFWR